MAVLTRSTLIAFFWLGDSKWTLIDSKLEYPVTCVVHCRDSFVAILSLGEISMFSGNNTDGVALLTASPSLLMPPPAHICQRSYLDMNNKMHLVSTILRVRYEIVTYKCDFLRENSWWSKVEDAEDIVFFVSKNFNIGFGVASISNISWNCIKKTKALTIIWRWLTLQPTNRIYKSLPLYYLGFRVQGLSPSAHSKRSPSSVAVTVMVLLLSRRAHCCWCFHLHTSTNIATWIWTASDISSMGAILHVTSWTRYEIMIYLCDLLCENSWCSKVEDAEDTLFFVSNISISNWNRVYLYEPMLCHQDQEDTNDRHLQMVDITDIRFASLQPHHSCPCISPDSNVTFYPAMTRGGPRIGPQF